LLSHVLKSFKPKDYNKRDERDEKKVKKWFEIELIKYFWLENKLSIEGIRNLWNDEERLIEQYPSRFLHMLHTS
jgi:hypothetical protein